MRVTGDGWNDPIEIDQPRNIPVRYGGQTGDRFFYLRVAVGEDSEIIKINIRCPVRGDVFMECVSLDEDLKMKDQIDILWDTKRRFLVDFRVEETEISNGTPEHNIPDSRCVETSHTELENIHSSAPEAESFEGDKDAIADTSSSQEAESVGPTSQEHELAENASAGEESEGSITNITANSDTQLADPPESSSPSGSASSSSRKFDEDTKEDGTADAEV
uniref:Uncharacterized protein n=1 Tax=Aegilops tauschii TaxID=37682 RepID=R7WEB6_AEGTA